MVSETLYRTMEAYYTDAVAKHGATPMGVDWTCLATQEMRFVQLLKICDFTAPFSLTDMGCGYGALLAYLSKRHSTAEVDYVGIDLSPAMIAHAKARYTGRDDIHFIVAALSPRVTDYTVASGIFNVKLDHPRSLWETYIAKTLRDMHAASRRGFAINFILPATSGDSMLYQTSPDPWICYCERELCCAVTTVENYGLQEFTLLAYRQQYSHPCLTTAATGACNDGG